ncbi:hypothetical protein B0H10DRAFT_1811937, partial [Mycena sp. CBHHK59/15]
FANRSMRFMDAYTKGLTGPEAAWASRKYPGHRTNPDRLMDDMEAAGYVVNHRSCVPWLEHIVFHQNSI